MLISLLTSSAVVYLGLRLSIQSSYYADPTRRFCGTFDRFCGWANAATNKVVGRWNSTVKFYQLPTTEPTNPESLRIYQDVRQWWWHPKQTPAGNMVAIDRFEDQRREKLGV